MAHLNYLRSAALAAVLAAAPALLPAPAEAAACLTSDVSLTIAGTLYAPSACANSVNNGNPATETSTISTALGVNGFTYLDKSDDASNPIGFGGVRFTVTASAGNSGSWTVSWMDAAGLPNLPLIVDFAVGLFGGNNGSAYLFNDVLLTNNPFSGTGAFDINFTNNGGQQPALSHLTLLGGDPHSPPPVNVPEPASMALLGAGLLGLGLVRRRWKQTDLRG